MEQPRLFNAAALDPAPSFFNPGHAFERIIRSWGAEKIQYAGSLFEKNADLSMERMVILTGTLRGILVLRSSMGFSNWLRRQRMDTSLGLCSEAEVFEELVSLLCLYLFHDFWNPRSFKIGPIHPFPSIPMDWPQGLPHAACGLQVESYPVEIRLWMQD